MTTFMQIFNHHVSINLAVMITSAIVGVVFGGRDNDPNTSVPWKVRMGLVFGGSVVALLGTAAGSGVACFLKIPFNVVSGKFSLYVCII